MDEGREKWRGRWRDGLVEEGSWLYSLCVCINNCGDVGSCGC